MGLLYRIKYPRLLLLLLSFIFAYFIFKERNFMPYHNFLIYLGYFGVFIAGCFYAYGFTAAPATAVLLSIAKDQNLILAGLIGGLGALAGDLVIFYGIRKFFINELRNLSKNKYIHTVEDFVEKEEKKIFGHWKKHVQLAFAGFILASPLPTEIGVTMLATSRKISPLKFSIFAYLLHTLGIFIIMLIGSLL